MPKHLQSNDFLELCHRDYEAREVAEIAAYRSSIDAGNSEEVAQADGVRALFAKRAEQIENAHEEAIAEQIARRDQELSDECDYDQHLNDLETAEFSSWCDVVEA